MAIPSALETGTSPAVDYAERWLASLNTAVTSADVDGLLSILGPTAWFRDLLVFTWDIRSSKGHEDIRTYLLNTLPKAHISDVKLDLRDGLKPRFQDLASGMRGVDVAFTFETPKAYGRGNAKVLVPSEGESRNGAVNGNAVNGNAVNGNAANGAGALKALSVMMMLSDWKGHEEMGFESSVPGGHTLAWEDVARQRREEVEKDPAVVIIGSGHTGLQIAARLRQMNIRALVIEQNPRVGDNWKKRYPTLYLHTPRAHHQLLYQPFPSNWPKFTSKDKLGDWLEQYAVSNDLTVWTSTRIVGRPTYDKTAHKWTLLVETPGVGSEESTQTELHPTHLISAIGLFGDPRMPIDASSPVPVPPTHSSKLVPTPTTAIPGLASFPGPVLHASAYRGGAAFTNQRVLVVGACNTSVDICQDLVCHRAAGVTMLQRSATTVVSDKLIDMQTGALWPDGQNVEVSDFWVSGSCMGMVKEMMIGMREQREAIDRELRDGLQKAGFKLSDGPEGAGQLIMVYERAQGYFIDVGCASLIINGQVKVKQGTEISRVEGKYVHFTDGSEIEVDALIFATGWKPSRENLYDLFGDEVMDQTEETWGIDEHGELRAGFKPSGYPGLWITAADFANVRWYSKQIALILKAIELGFVSYDEFVRDK